MDWYLDASDGNAVTLLRQELRQYLDRHADEEADVDGAEVAFSELVTNAVRHAPGPAWVHLDWSDPQPLVEVHDLGPGFDLHPALPEDPFAAGGRGLFIASHLTEELAVASKAAGGSKVTARLPVGRAVEQSYDPPRSLTASLPTSAEADEEGGFGKESFLLALVVEMARSVEAREGPDAAEALVAQVGANIGGRMEEEYRRARDLVDALEPSQIADLYVRLKAAINGDFYVVEATEERIVLGNRACPFGEAVKQAPGLCRMTSSVFGGIAARNAGGASVMLEERIAVGDPECRVVIRLGGPEDEEHGFGHSYAGPARPGEPDG
jgi:anti-sigma regulatory factor (Ser/Thr protein kinase)/predicted ArsR family transcriptional regulator